MGAAASAQLPGDDRLRRRILIRVHNTGTSIRSLGANASSEGTINRSQFAALCKQMNGGEPMEEAQIALLMDRFGSDGLVDINELMLWLLPNRASPRKSPRSKFQRAKLVDAQIQNRFSKGASSLEFGKKYL